MSSIKYSNQSDGVRFSISAHNLDLEKGIKQYAVEKIKRFSKYFDGLLLAHINFNIKKYRHKVEILLKNRRQIFRSRDTAGDFNSAFDLVYEELNRQITKFKERRKGKKHILKARVKSAGLTQPLLESTSWVEC